MPELEELHEHQHVGNIVITELAVIIVILVLILHEIEELEHKQPL